jgi:hypothetical protein
MGYWKHQQSGKQDVKVFVDYFSPTGVITKFPAIDSFGQVIGVLSAAEWELVNVQHRLYTTDSFGVSTIVGGQMTGLWYPHPSGGFMLQFEGANIIAYFKRPIQAGRNIDDAL